jgi:membrane protein DedA with SNARE-associated domain
MELLPAFITKHIFVMAFFGAFAGGSSITLILAVLAGQGMFPVVELATGAALGNFCSDAVWFTIGRSTNFIRWKRAERISKGFLVVQNLWKKYRKSDLGIFILVKFLYGLRVITILFLGKIRYPVSRFMGLNAVAVICITIFLVTVGWSTGRGATLVLDIFGWFRIALTGFVAALLVYAASCSLLRHVFVQKGDVEEEVCPQDSQ